MQKDHVYFHNKYQKFRKIKSIELKSICSLNLSFIMIVMESNSFVTIKTTSKGECHYIKFEILKYFYVEYCILKLKFW